MDARTRTLNKYVKRYDEDLIIRCDNAGVRHLYRKKPICSSFEYDGITYVHSHVIEQHIMSLTKTWKQGAPGVDWGIDPLMRKISEIDSWRDDTGYDEFCKRRELAEKYTKQSQKNELRAMAADMRVDFAKATNDIVTRAGSRNL